MPGNIARTDPLKPRPRLGVANRGVPTVKLVEGQLDAALLRTVPLDPTLPTNGQVPMYSASLGKYKATTVSVDSGVASHGVLGSSADTHTNLYSSGGSLRVELGPSNPGVVLYGPGAVPLVYVGQGGTYDTVIDRGLQVIANAVGQPSLQLHDGTNGVTLLTPGNNILDIGGSGGGGKVRLTAIQFGASDKITFSSGGNMNVGPTINASVAFRAGNNEIRDSTNVTRFLFNPGANTISHFGALVAGDVRLLGDSTTEQVVRRTKSGFTETKTGTGTMHLIPSDHTHAANTNYRVEIDGAGALETATFRWSDDGGGTWDASGVLTDPGVITLQNGVQIFFSAGTFVVGDRWDWTAIGTANQVELLRADTRNDVLVLRNVEITANTAAFATLLNANLIYSGANVSSITAQIAWQGTNASGGVTQTGYGLLVAADMARTVGTTSITSLRVVMTSSATGGTFTLARAAEIDKAWTSQKPTTAQGLFIKDLGDAAITTLAALQIEPQTVGTTAINIYQRGTTGVNRLAAPTLIGADASPAAGNALQLSGGALQLAASPNNLIKGAGGFVVLGEPGTHTTAESIDSRDGANRVNLNTAGSEVVIAAMGLIVDASSYATLGASYALGVLLGAQAVVDGFTTFGFLYQGNVVDDLATVHGVNFAGAISVATGTSGTFNGISLGDPALVSLYVEGAGTWTAANGIVSGLGVGTGGIVTTLRQFYARRSTTFTPAAGSTRSMGFDIENMGDSDFTRVYSIRMAQHSAGTSQYAIFIDNATTPGDPTPTGNWAILSEQARVSGLASSLYVGGTVPTTPAGVTAKVHIAAGSTAASSAPIKFISGSLMTTAEAGAVEFLTDKAYLTITTGAARKEFTLNDSALTSGRIPIATTNGRLMDAPQQTYTPTNVTTDRSYDANATSLDELADVVGTVIADLQAVGLMA